MWSPMLAKGLAGRNRGPRPALGHRNHRRRSAPLLLLGRVDSRGARRVLPILEGELDRRARLEPFQAGSAGSGSESTANGRRPRAPSPHRVVHAERVAVRPSHDFTAHLRVGGLRPGEDYWYAFKTRNRRSRAGHFRTLRPADSRQPRAALGTAYAYPTPALRVRFLPFGEVHIRRAIHWSCEHGPTNASRKPTEATHSLRHGSIRLDISRHPSPAKCR